MRHYLSVVSIALAVGASEAHAWERNYTMRGEGWFEGENRRFGRFDLREARLTVRENGEFAVTLFVRNERYLVRGRWDRRGRGNVDRIDIRDAFGRRASGSGTLQYGFDRDEPERLVLRGRTSDGDFSAELRDDGRWDRRDDRDDRWGRDRDRDDDRWDWVGGAEVNERGSGRLRQDVGPDLVFDRLRVRLEANRQAWIYLEGRRQTVQLRGRWSGERGDDVRIDVSSVNEMSARGRVVLRRERNGGQRLDGNGRTELGRFEVEFR